MREIAEALGLSHQRIHQMVEAAGGEGVRGGRGKLLSRFARRGDCGEPQTYWTDRVFGARFDAETRAVLSLAQEEAYSRGHNYLGTEHALLGLLRTETLAAQVLASLGVTLGRASGELAERLGEAEGAAHSRGPLCLLPRLKRALDLAVKEAKAQRRPVASSEHLLLGIVRVKGLATEVLGGLGVDEKELFRRVGRASLQCSFCHRPGSDVAHLVAGPGVLICEACVEVASRIAGRRPAGDAAGFLLADQTSGTECSFCGKTAGQVEGLHASGDLAICSACLVFCREIQAEEASAA